MGFVGLESLIIGGEFVIYNVYNSYDLFWHDDINNKKQISENTVEYIFWEFTNYQTWKFNMASRHFSIFYAS